MDIFQKHLLFYFIGGFYAILFLIIGYLLDTPGIGLENTVQSPSRIIGWVSYLGIESFGSLMVALFWSFVASSTTPESAKLGYPTIITGAQVGSISGPFLVTQSESLGIPNLMYISFSWIISIILLIALYVRVIPEELSGIGDSSGESKSKKKHWYA